MAGLQSRRSIRRQVYKLHNPDTPESGGGEDEKSNINIRKPTKFWLSMLWAIGIQVDCRGGFSYAQAHPYARSWGFVREARPQRGTCKLILPRHLKHFCLVLYSSLGHHCCEFWPAINILRSLHRGLYSLPSLLPQPPPTFKSEAHHNLYPTPSAVCQHAFKSRMGQGSQARGSSRN